MLEATPSLSRAMRLGLFAAAVFLIAIVVAGVSHGEWANVHTVQANVWEVAAQLHAPGDTTTQTVLTSTVPSAWTIRAQIQQLLNSGKTQQQVIRLLIGEYGSAILASPAPSGFGLLVFVLPMLCVCVSLAAAIMLVIKRLGHTTLDSETDLLAVVKDDEEWRAYL